MSSGTDHDVVIVVNLPDQVFNAPTINPFSENVLEILGMSGLAYAIRQLQAHRRDWKNTRLLVRLPSDQITPGLDRRLVDAVQRYCRAKIEDNELEIRLIRFRSRIGLGILAGIVVALVVGAYFLFTGPLAGVSQVVQVVIAASISLFAWVSLWDPLEALLFNPIALMRENFILRRIAKLEISIEPDTPIKGANGAAGVRAISANTPTAAEPRE
jgi:hypothetical protein